MADDTTSRVARWGGPALIAAAAAAMLCSTWGTWPDVLVDFGRELYVPWQIAEGKALYRDIVHLRGPLSSYANALAFALFGTSLRTMVACNLVLLAALVAMLYRLLVEIGGRLAATLACLTFVGVFAFGQLTVYGNYNFVCPYAVEMTHGVVLSVAALFCLMLYLRRPRRLHVVLAGLAMGLTFLTKAEPFVACAAATLLGFGLACWVRGSGWGRVGLLVGMALVPPLVAFALLWTAMPAGRALTGVLGQWPYLLRPEVRGLRFYRAGSGMGSPGQGVLRMLGWTAAYVAVLAPPGVLGLVLRRRLRVRPAIAALVSVGAAALLAYHWQAIRWQDAARPLPVAMLVAAAALAVYLWKRRRSPEAARQVVLRLSVVVFAMALLLKMLLNARLYHYGFALAMPATLVLVVALVDWVPSAIRRAGGYAPVFLAAVVGIWGVWVAVHLRFSASFLARKTVTVGSGADAFLADGRGVYVNSALGALAERVEPSGTVAVLPDGVMLNYLLRRANPTPHPDAMPAIVAMHREERMLAAYRASPPDVVVLVHKDTSEGGYRFFGRDYARELFAWIQSEYRPVLTVGAPPLRDHRFGIQVLERVGSE